MRNLSDYQNMYSKALGKKEILEDNLLKTRKNLENTNINISDLEEAQTLLQQVAQQTQSQLRYRIEGIVQLALDAVLPGKYTFEVNFEIKRDRTEAQLIFKKGDLMVEPLESSGGGVADLASFALRVAAWSLGNTRKTIVLDEPFKGMGGRSPVAGEIMRQLSDKLGIQFIMITHNEEMVDIADKVFYVTIEDGITEVKER